MNSRHLILAFLFTLTAPVFARDNTDRLTMNNGDSMTCEIKGLDGGVLYVSLITSTAQRPLTGRR
jgi:hypothetical protein